MTDPEEELVYFRKYGRFGTRASVYGRIQREVGVEPYQRLDWAFKFASPKDDNEWDGARLRLSAFTNSLVWWPEIPEKFRNDLKAKFGRPEKAGDYLLLWDEDDKPEQRFLPRIDEAIATHASVRSVLVELLANGSVRQTLERIISLDESRAEPRKSTIRDWVVALDGDAPGHIFWRYPQDKFSEDLIPFQDRTLRVLYELLAGVPKNLIRICREEHKNQSSRLFVAARGNKKYCSDQCQARAATRRFRNK